MASPCPTRLPGATWRVPAMPVMGDVMVQYSTFSSAWRMLALAASTAACACWIAAVWLTLAVFSDACLPSTSALAACWAAECVVIVLLRHGSLFGQRFQPLDVLIGLVQLRQRDLHVGLRGVDHGSVLGLRQVRLGLGQLRLGLHELGFVLALVEREEHLPRLDHRAFVVALRQEKRLHARADIHRVGGVGARRQFGEERHGLLNDGGNHDGDGGRQPARSWPSHSNSSSFCASASLASNAMSEPGTHR